MNNRNLRELEMKILIIRMKTSVKTTEDKSEAISQNTVQNDKKKPNKKTFLSNISNIQLIEVPEGETRKKWMINNNFQKIKIEFPNAKKKKVYFERTHWP